MAKPVKGENLVKNTGKTAAQLKKEEEERKRKAAEEAAKTSEQKRNELRAEQGLQPSVNVGRVSSSGATHGGGAGSFAPKEEHYDGGAAVRAEKESVYREPTKEEKQQEQGYRRRQTNQTSTPAKFTPTGAKLTKTTPKASDLLPGQTEHLAKEATRRAFEAAISGDKKTEEIYNTLGRQMRERLYGGADNIDLLNQAAANALKKGTPLQTVYSVGGYRFTLDDLERAGYDKEAIQRVKALGDRKTQEQTKERNKAFTASYIPTQEQAEHIQQHYRSSLGQAVKEAEERIIHGPFANEKERAAFGAQYRNWNEQYQAMLMADADDDAIHAEINDVQAKLREIERNGRTISVVNATDANDRVEYDEAARNFYLNKLNTLQQIADYKADRYVLAQIEGKNATAKFDELFSLYNQRAVVNERIYQWESKANSEDDRAAAKKAADLRAYDLGDITKKIQEAETALKKLGFNENHFQLYSDMKNQALSQKINLAAENLVDLFPGLKGIAVAAGGLALSGVTAPGRGIARAMDLANTEGRGYQVGKILQDAVSSMTGAVVRNIEERYEGPVGKALGQLYQIAESTIDSVVNDTVMGKFAAPVMGLNACAQEYDDALARGIPQKQAAALGVMAGVFETLFEYLSLEKIHKIADVTHVGKRGLAEAFLKSGVFEGLEELNTSVANYAVDYLVAGGLSKYNTAMANGYTPAQHAVETLKEIGIDALGGFISGVALGGTAGLARQGYGQAVRYGNNIAAGREIAKGGNVTQVIGAAKASENQRTQRLGGKLEEKVQKGKNASLLTGRVYNRIQGENIYDAARQRAIDLAAERGETITDRQADAIATAVRESQETLRLSEDGNLVYTLSPGAETAVQEGIGKDVLDEYTGSKKTAAWAEATRRNFAEFARDTGAYVDDVARVQRIERGIRDRMAETNKALREGNGTQLVTKAVEGTFRTEGGKTSSVTIGGIDGVTENNAIRVVVDGDGKGGVQTTAVLDLREDAPAGTVTLADEAQRELYLSLNGAVTGQLTQTVEDDYGTGYRPDLTTPMSLPAANNLIAMYDPDVNKDAGAFVAWGYDAFKAASRGMAWQQYLDMYRQGKYSAYGKYITDAQLREAFRAGQAQFEAKPGVTRIGTADISSRVRAKLQGMDEVLSERGFALIIVDHFEDINGYVSDRADVAVVALDSEEVLFEVAAFHEIYHVLTRELGISGGRQFVSAVLAEYRKAVGTERFNEDLEDVAKRYDVDKAGLADEDARWQVYEEMAAQYFGVIAAEHMDGLVDGLNRTGGQRLRSKVREILRQFVEDIRAALSRLAGRDPATAAALKTEAENAQRILDLFDEAVAQTGEVREQRLAEQGESIREEALRSESAESSAETYSLKSVAPVQPSSDTWERTLTTAEAMERFPNLWNVAAEESEKRNPTQIASTQGTYRNIYDILKNEGFSGKILDASSGLGLGTKVGREEYGFTVDDIEPYPDAEYKPKYTDYSKLDNKYDAIISSAVLNVLPQDQRDALVVKMGELLNDGGRMFITTRGRDVDSLAKSGKNIHLGNMEWIETVRGSYQKGFAQNELIAYLQDALGDGFTVQGSVQAGVGKFNNNTSIVVTKNAAGSQEGNAAKQESGEVDIDGNTTSHTYSKRSLAVGLGYDFKEVDGIYQVVDSSGTPVKNITEEVVKRSPLGNMVGIAVARGNITRAEAAQQYEMLAQLLQMTVDYKDFTLPWEISGSLLFSAIKANSDAQYGRTIDFSTICKKTQTIINVMSKTMMDLNRGLTAKEVREIVYEEVGKAGEPTPCPVCYVFSRWMGIGGILQNIYDFQNKYNDAAKEDVLRLCEETEKRIRAFADAKEKDDYFDKDGNYKYGKIVSEMKSKPDGRVKRAQTKIDAHYEALETIEYTQQQLKKSGLDQKTIDAYNDILKAAKKKVLTDRTFKNAQKTIEDGRRELAPLEEYQFLKSTRFNSDGIYDESYTPVRGENGKTAQQALADVLFDLNNAEGLATKYPALWRYRSTRGCNAGKAILPYSDMWTGEIVQGIAGDIKDIQRGDANAFLNGDSERQQELLDSAQRKQAAQNIIGGMRFQSTSDFRYEYGSDYLMAFLELQAIGANVQLYTKVIEAVDFFASMGADCNLSLMPENDGFRIDENGNRVLAFSSVTGINSDGAFKLIDKYDNVQAILVGISDEHISTAIGDRRIGFVIPFHGSGNTVKVIADLMSLLKQNLDITTAKDYSTVQNDRERSEKSYHGDTAMYERHKRLRQLRMMILTGRDGGKNAEFTDEDRRLIGENPYLTDLYYRFWVDKSNKGEYGVRLTKSQAEKIFPFEYWDKSATLDKADVNGRRFIEYCESIGYYPRFSGVVDANGKKGAYGDFTGNTGYWKLLIDRPMYDLNGKYRDQQKINATSMQTNFLSPAWATEQYGEYMQKDSTKDMELVADIAQRVEDRIAGEEGEVITESRRTQTVEEKYDEAVAENAELKDQLRETKRLLKDAQKKLDKATFDAWIAGQETGGRVPVRNQVLDVVKKYNDPKLTGVSNEALTQRIVDSLLAMNENDYAVDVLVNDLWGTMFDKASGQTETVENEMRDIIRGVTAGQRYVVSDSEFDEIVETIGSRAEMNRTFKRVYGFTLFPQREAASKNLRTSFDEGMQELTDALPGVFSRTDENGYDMDNGSVANMAVSLYEMQDSMAMKEYDAEEVYGAETLYEGAMADASRFAEDIIRLTPLRTVADEYVQKMDELRTAYRGKLQAKQKEIESLRGKLERRDAALDRTRTESEERLAAQREYYQNMRREQAEKRRDTQNRARLRKRLIKDVKWLRERLENATDQKHIPEEMKKVVVPFVSAFLENEAVLDGGHAVFSRDSIDRLLTFYQRLNDQDSANDDYSAQLAFMYGLYDADIAEKLKKMKETLDGRRLSEMTAQELIEMDDVIANLRHLIRDANSAYVNGKRIQFSESGQRLMQETRAKKKDRSNLAYKIKTGADGINVNMAKPIYLFKEVVGGEIRQYFDAIREAQNVWAFRIRDSAAAIAEIKKKYHYDDWSGKKNNETFTLSDGTTVVLTKDAVMQIYATYKRERSEVTQAHHLTQGGIVLSEDLSELQRKSAKKVARSNANAEMIDSKAHPLTEEDLRNIFNTLTDDQRKYADECVRYLSDTVSGWGNEASMELHGYKKFGSGYYFPYQSSGLYLRQSIGVGDDARLKNKGFTKALTPGANNPIVITGFSEVMAKHIGDMASYSTLAVPLENLNRLLNYKLDKSNGVKADLNDTYGGKVSEYITEFLKQMNGGVKTDKTSGLFDRMTSRFKRSAVAMNLSVMVQQPSAIARAMAMVDPQYFVTSSFHWFDYRQLKKYSGVAVIKELGGWDTGTGRSTTDFLLGESSFADAVAGWTGKGAEVMDAITWSHIWNAVKRETAHEMGIKYRRKGMSEEFYRRAAARFNEVADYTQVYDSTLSRSQWMRSQNGVVKMATAFMAEPTTSYNMLVFSGMKRNGKSINKARAIGAFVANVILNTALQSLVGAWRDKDDKSYWERYFKHLIEGVFGTRENLFTDSEFNILNMIPFVKDIISIFQGYDVDRSDMTLVTDIVKPLRKLIDAFRDRDDDEAILDFLQANSDLLIKLGITLSNLTPLPMKSVYRDFIQAPMTAIEHFKDDGYHTTAQHIADIWEQNFKGEWDKNEQLYYAMIQGDKAALDKYLKVTDADVQKYVNDANDEYSAREHARALKEKQFHNKVQDALKQMDSRIMDAARALMEYDYETAERLTDAVAADGFDRNDVVCAINEVKKTLKPDKEYNDKETEASYFASMTDMKELAVAAMSDGFDFDTAVANARKVRDALQDQGKTDKDIDGETQEPINAAFVAGEIDIDEARRLYKGFTTFDDSNINKHMIDRVADRYANGGMTLDEAEQMYVALGVKEDKVAEKLGKLVTADYENKKFTSKDEAVTAYMKYTGEEDRGTAELQFDYTDEKTKDEKFPLEYKAYRRYRTYGLDSLGVTPETYATFEATQTQYTSATTSPGWEQYKARTASVKATKKFTAIQWHTVNLIDNTFSTPDEKTAAYKAIAEKKDWSLAKLPYVPW